MKTAVPTLSELSILENRLKSEKPSASKKLKRLQSLGCTQQFVDVSDSRSYYQELMKLYRHSKDCGIQTIIVASKLSCKSDPIQTVIENKKDYSNTMKKLLTFSLRNLLPIGVERNSVMSRLSR